MSAIHITYFVNSSDEQVHFSVNTLFGQFSGGTLLIGHTRKRDFTNTYSEDIGENGGLGAKKMICVVSVKDVQDFTDHTGVEVKLEGGLETIIRKSEQIAPTPGGVVDYVIIVDFVEIQTVIG